MRMRVPTCKNMAFFCRCYSILHRRSLLMTQYDRIKSQFPDHILLFQLGDFYEIMGSDAALVSSKTTLRIANRNNIPLVGFPVRSLDEWQRTLVEAGFNLAICNQTSNKNEGNRLVSREVVRLVTPGTLLEPLNNEANNYLMAIATGPGQSLGLAWIDISTACFEVLSATDINEHIDRVSPSEVLLSEEVYNFINSSSPSSSSSPLCGLTSLASSSVLRECLLTSSPKMWFEHSPSSTQYREILNELKSGVFSLLEKRAVYAILHYTLHTQRNTMPFIKPPTIYGQQNHMTIDAATRRALEITIPQHTNSKKSTLLGCIDMTITSAGSRLIRRMISSPLTCVDSINNRLSSVESFHQSPHEIEWLRQKLKTCGDLERILQKITVGSSCLSDLFSVQVTLQCMDEIITYLSKHLNSLLETELTGLKCYPKLTRELGNAIDNGDYGFYIRNGYSDKLDDLRLKMKANEKQVKEFIDKLIEYTGISRFNVVSHKTYFRVFETTKSKSKLLDDYITNLMRIDHTQSAVRYTHVELQRMNAEYQNVEACYNDLINETFKYLCNEVILYKHNLLESAEGLAKLDVYTSLAQLALNRGFCKPVVSKDRVFNICGGFHPVISDIQKSGFQSNDCYMNEHSLWIITGPNMGGKSTFLRQNALLIILAQMGSFVPAQSATIGMVDKLFARIGAHDNVTNHQSTFHLEMSEMAHIVNNATSNSFIILDEIGRGTSPKEGVAIAQAVLEYIHNSIGCRALLATHFHGLHQNMVSRAFKNIGCYHVTAQKCKNGLIFTYRIKPGHADSSLGIEVAELSGLPLPIIIRSKELLETETTQTCYNGVNKTFNDNTHSNKMNNVFTKLQKLFYN